VATCGVVEARANLGLAQRQPTEKTVRLEPPDRPLVESQALSRPPWLREHRSALEPPGAQAVSRAERETDPPPQPAPSAAGAEPAREPLRVCLAQALLVALASEKPEGVEVVGVHALDGAPTD